ncbi:hypothetical protein CRUP_012723 [Coryphaenoides rupestris]|nr:hypothetical protein CRUP_012723 [Coryphaenoides rupestris]
MEEEEEEEEEGSSGSAAEQRQDGGPLGPGGEDGPLAPEPRSPLRSPLRSTTRSTTRSTPLSTPLATRSTPLSTPLHRRHMPTDTLRFHIPRKKETTALFRYVSSESREFEDMLTILTSSYKDENSSQSFTYSKPRLVHNAGLEAQFVEKRKEMKSEGRTELELKESHCFLLADPVKVSHTHTHARTRVLLCSDCV